MFSWDTRQNGNCMLHFAAPPDVVPSSLLAIASQENYVIEIVLMQFGSCCELIQECIEDLICINKEKTKQQEEEENCSLNHAVMGDCCFSFFQQVA